VTISVGLGSGLSVGPTKVSAGVTAVAGSSTSIISVPQAVLVNRSANRHPHKSILAGTKPLIMFFQTRYDSYPYDAILEGFRVETSVALITMEIINA
jgi:hypothetical protein